MCKMGGNSRTSYSADRVRTPMSSCSKNLPMTLNPPWRGDGDRCIDGSIAACGTLVPVPVRIREIRGLTAGLLREFAWDGLKIIPLQEPEYWILEFVSSISTKELKKKYTGKPFFLYCYYNKYVLHGNSVVRKASRPEAWCIKYLLWIRITGIKRSLAIILVRSFGLQDGSRLKVKNRTTLWHWQLWV